MFTGGTVFVLLSLLVPSASGGEKAFWQTKKMAIERIEAGEILVNVKTTDTTMQIEGGGHVHRPLDQVFAYAGDFDHIEHLGLYVDSAKFDRSKHEMALRISALGVTRDFKVRARVVEDASPKRIDLEILEGPFSGLRTSLAFRSLDLKRTEVGIHGEYTYTGNRFGKLFRGIAIETILQRVAQRLRTGVEQ